MADSAGPIEGGCFCGKVRYEYDPDYIAFRYCFCSRCRKLRGTANATNAFVNPASFRWVRGEDSINQFVLEGSRFGNWFCNECGSPVPRLVPGGKAVLIPAGGLDSDPGIAPDTAIFWDSRAEWLPSAEELEKKSEY